MVCYTNSKFVTSISRQKLNYYRDFLISTEIPIIEYRETIIEAQISVFRASLDLGDSPVYSILNRKNEINKKIYSFLFIN